jgi:hypothetical protein
MKTTPDGDGADTGEVVQLFSTTQLKGFISNIVDNYYDINNSDNFEYSQPWWTSTGEVVPIELYYYTLDKTVEK